MFPTFNSYGIELNEMNNAEQANEVDKRTQQPKVIKTITTTTTRRPLLLLLPPPSLPPPNQIFFLK